MYTKTAFVSLVLLTAFALPATASSPAEMPEGAEANGPTSITADLKCRVEEVGENSTIVLVDLETETRHEIQLDDTVNIRARKKKDFDGRKKLGLADLRAGQTVKVTYQVTDGAIRKITVLERA